MEHHLIFLLAPGNFSSHWDVVGKKALSIKKNKKNPNEQKNRSKKVDYSIFYIASFYFLSSCTKQRDK